MWKYPIKNFILPKERKRWIKALTDWLEQLKLEDNVLEVEIEK